MSTINLYACGGTATNIANLLLESMPEQTEGLANINVVMVDTSDSNLRHGKTATFQKEGKASFYHVYDKQAAVDGRETDGMGKNRKLTYEVAATHVPTILHSHAPEKFNIVLHSLSGGSGSVLGPLLAKAILEAGQDVIVIATGNEADTADIENTQRSLYGYQNLAEKIGKPICMSYLHTSKETPRAIVNAEAILQIGAIAVITSRQNHGLDSMDIHNFLHFTEKSPFPVGLAALTFSYGEKNPVLQDGEAFSGILSLVAKDEQIDMDDVVVPYLPYGHVREEILGNVGLKSPVRVATVQNFFRGIDSLLRKAAKHHAETFKAVSVEKMDVGAAGGVQTDDGLVL